MTGEKESFQKAIEGRKQKELSPKYPPFFICEEEGDWVAGVISDPREIETEYGMMRVVTLTAKDGEVHSLSLSVELAGLWEMTGKYVVVKFTGKTRNANRKGFTKHFEVYA